jgi:hypothetical protein
MEVALSGQLSHRHVRQAAALHLSLPMRVRVFVGIMLSILGTAALGNAANPLFPALRDYGFRGPGYLPLLAFTSGIVSLPLWRYYLIVALQQRRADPSRSARSGRACVEGVYLEGISSRSSLDWQAFLYHRLAPGLILLYVQPALYYVFPREHFASEPDWQTFVELARRRVPEVDTLGIGTPAREALAISAVAFVIGCALYCLG